MKEQYSTTTRDDRSKSYIVNVEKSTCFKTEQPREWYLPHHPVIYPNEPGKVSRTLNGAADIHGHSLSNALPTGPDLLRNLAHTVLYVLPCFQKHSYAVLAQIEGTFLQVGFFPKDQRSLRCLWQEDPTAEVALHQYAEHIFGSKDWPKFAPETEMMRKETHELTTLTTHATINASTIEWQKYSPYDKRLHNVAYMLRVLPKSIGNRTDSGCITDPNKLLEADRRFFLRLQTESFFDLAWSFEAANPGRHYPLGSVS